MTCRRSCLAVSSFAALFLAAGLVTAQPSPGTAPSRAKAAAAAQRVPVRTVTESQDARETRDELRQVLERYSPGLGGVLKLDPTLLTSAEYLAPYPGLAEFLSNHPAVVRDPAYFFENVAIPDDGRSSQPTEPRIAAMNMWREVIGNSMVLIVSLTVLAALVWLIKTLIDYRRWSRLSKVQADVHNKVVDRFANNEELFAYVQTPAGRRFLESAPIALDPTGPTIGAPVRRILWAVEAGFVILAGGIGLQYVSGRVPEEISPMLITLGVLGVALGLGFVVAAAVSFLISRRLGLLPTAAPTADRGQTHDGASL
jgi:hypothetical protein